jgi:hypothetical protein
MFHPVCAYQQAGRIRQRCAVKEPHVEQAADKGDFGVDRFPRWLKPHSFDYISGGTEVPPFQNSHFFRILFTCEVRTLT